MTLSPPFLSTRGPGLPQVFLGVPLAPTLDEVCPRSFSLQPPTDPPAQDLLHLLYLLT